MLRISPARAGCAKEVGNASTKLQVFDVYRTSSSCPGSSARSWKVLGAIPLGVEPDHAAVRLRSLRHDKGERQIWSEVQSKFEGILRPFDRKCCPFADVDSL